MIEFRHGCGNDSSGVVVIEVISDSSVVGRDNGSIGCRGRRGHQVLVMIVVVLVVVVIGVVVVAVVVVVVVVVGIVIMV